MIQISYQGGLSEGLQLRKVPKSCLLVTFMPFVQDTEMQYQLSIPIQLMASFMTSRSVDQCYKMRIALVNDTLVKTLLANVF